MNDSTDSGKRDHTLTDWTTNPFERVNHSTNFEDYAITTETSSMYSQPMANTATNSQTKITTKGNDSAKRDPMSNSFPKIYLKPKTLGVPKAFQMDSAFSDSGHSSTEVTPATTPQSSPYTLRKMFEINKVGNQLSPTTTQIPAAADKKVSANTKRWFYNGFFGSDEKATATLPKNPSLKNLCISNFDINAVGPTSW